MDQPKQPDAHAPVKPEEALPADHAAAPDAGSEEPKGQPTSDRQQTEAAPTKPT